jgi:hypothetical protein
MQIMPKDTSEAINIYMHAYIQPNKHFLINGQNLVQLMSKDATEIIDIFRTIAPAMTCILEISDDVKKCQRHNGTTRTVPLAMPCILAISFPVLCSQKSLHESHKSTHRAAA